MKNEILDNIVMALPCDFSASDHISTDLSWRIFMSKLIETTSTYEN